MEFLTGYWKIQKNGPTFPLAGAFFAPRKLSELWGPGFCVEVVALKYWQCLAPVGAEDGAVILIVVVMGWRGYDDQRLPAPFGNTYLLEIRKIALYFLLRKSVWVAICLERSLMIGCPSDFCSPNNLIDDFKE